MGKVNLTLNINANQVLRVCARAVNAAGLRSTPMCSDGVNVGKMETKVEPGKTTTCAFGVTTVAGDNAVTNETEQANKEIKYAALQIPPGATQPGATFVAGQLQDEEYDGKDFENPAQANTSNVPNIRIGSYSFTVKIKTEDGIQEGYQFAKPVTFCFVVDLGALTGSNSNSSQTLAAKDVPTLMLRNVTSGLWINAESTCRYLALSLYMSAVWCLRAGVGAWA